MNVGANDCFQALLDFSPVYGYGSIFAGWDEIIFTEEYSIPPGNSFVGSLALMSGFALAAELIRREDKLLGKML